MEEKISDKKFKILIVEEKENGAKGINDYFLGKKYLSKIISYETNVIERLEKELFDIVILCLEVYCSEGYGIIRSIRNSKKYYEEIPVLALARNSREEYLYFCKGASEVLCKPFTLENIEEKVSRYLNPFNKPINLYKNSLSLLIEKLKLTEKNAKSFLDEYMEMLQEFIPQIKEDCIRGDYDSIRKKAHQIKGVSAVLRIYSIQKISYEIEKNSQEKELCESVSKLETILIQLEKERKMFKEI